MTAKTKVLRVVDHPELGKLELLSDEVFRWNAVPAESQRPQDYEVLEKPILAKLLGLALPKPDGRMSLTRALLRDRWRIVMCEQRWRWLNPEAKGRKDRWREARCVYYASARTAKRPQVPDFATQILWARPDIELIWSGEPDQPQPPASPCFFRIVTGDDLWPLLADIRFKPGTQVRARQLVNRLADNFNRQAFAGLLLRIQPPGTHGGFALHNGIRAKLARHFPRPGAVFISSPTLQRWFRDWRDSWNLGVEMPQLSQFVERINESLPPERWIRTPQELRQLLDAQGVSAGWKLLSRFGSQVLRPFDQALDRRAENFRELFAGILVQTRMGNAELFPPWFLRQYIRLREEAGGPPLGQKGWRHLPPELFSEAGRRAGRAKAAATRLKLLREVSLLLACPSAAVLQVAYESGGWQAALGAARDESLRLANALEIQGLRFVSLVTQKDFAVEGAAMGHCLGDEHYEKGQRNRSIQYVSVRLPTGSRLATATLRFEPGNGWLVREENGPRNSRVDDHVKAALRSYASQLAAPERPPLPMAATKVKLDAISRVLPRSGLCPADLALIRGLGNGGTIALVEPPAGGMPEPYLDPHQLLMCLSKPTDPLGQLAAATADAERWMASLPPVCRVVALADDPQDHIRRVPALAFAFELERQGWLDRFTLDYLYRVIAAASSTEIAPPVGPRMSLDAWLRTPFAGGLSEFQPGPVWYDAEASWQRWREQIRPIAWELEQVLGEAVCHLADPEDEFDDDVFHRNLILHACCELEPTSRFVRFLVDTSEAGNVETLQRALLDPASYAAPFLLEGFGSEVWVETLRFQYPFLEPRENF